MSVLVQLHAQYSRNDSIPSDNLKDDTLSPRLDIQNWWNVKRHDSADLIQVLNISRFKD
jgi:hypothetical protein